MTTTIQAMTPNRIMALLTANGIDHTIRDLGASGGGDWWAIEVSAPRDRFILITYFDSPFDGDDGDDTVESLAICLYDSGEYEDDLGERAWTYLGTEEVSATPDAILAAVAALRAHAEVWDSNA